MFFNVNTAQCHRSALLTSKTFRLPGIFNSDNALYIRRESLKFNWNLKKTMVEEMMREQSRREWALVGTAREKMRGKGGTG